MAGDVTAMKVCIDRLLPPRKDRPLKLALPRMESSSDAVAVQAETLAQVAAGVITPSEGVALAGLVENFRRALETEVLDARIAKLEQGR